jgi:hypothetical protein
VELPYSNIKTLDVRFDWSGDPHANVTPPKGAVFRENGWNGPLDWIANLDSIKPVYLDALNRALQKEGRTCTIENARAFPSLFMLEYTLRCS